MITDHRCATVAEQNDIEKRGLYETWSFIQNMVHDYSGFKGELNIQKNSLKYYIKQLIGIV